MSTSNLTGKPLILAVDDIPKNLQLIGAVLKSEGYRMILTTNPKEVLEIVREQLPDLILLDVMMPEIDGFELCKEIKAEDRIKDIPIIFVTGKTDISDITKGFMIGGSDYITKPFRTRELLARVKTHLQLKNALDTIQIRNRQLLDEISAKNRLFSMVSHDLKVPLSTLLGLSEMLDHEYETLEDVERVDLVKRVSRSVDAVRKLVDQLSEWVRLQSGGISFAPEEVDVSELILSTVELAGKQGLEKGVQMETVVPEDLKAYCDPYMLASIIRNLVSNAVKFTPENRKVMVGAFEEDQEIVFSVKDEGIGMPKQMVARLFRPGESISRKGTSAEPGTGFGLIMVKEMVNYHNGKIIVKSDEDEGTEFEIRLPKNLHQIE